MDIHHPNKQQKLVKSRKNKEKHTMKVVYISSPMKVKASASKFRAIVQELTGRESDVVRIMERSGGRDTWTVPDHQHHQQQHIHHHDHQGIIGGCTHDGVVPPLVVDPDSRSSSSPASSSEELINPFDGVLVRGQDGFGPLDPSLLFDQFFHQLDVLGSY